MINSKEWREAAQKMLEAEEGVRNKPHRDQFGKWTIGIGHNLDANPLSDDEVQYIFNNDLLDTVDAACRSVGADFFNSLDAVRQHAIINMVFQLGEHGFNEFHATRAAIFARDWKGAASYARQSRWAKQTPNRAERVCFMLETGQYPKRYNIA